MKGWMIEMYIRRYIGEYIETFLYFAIIIGIILLYVFGIVSAINIYKQPVIKGDSNWMGNYPGELYHVVDTDTGVYYVITDTGDINEMYTIEGEVKLVDQGNEYVVHKNLGEPDAQE